MLVKREKFSGPGENCQKNATDLTGSLVTSSRPPQIHVFLHKFFERYTHTHPFNGPLFGTTRVSQYQKGKTNLDFTEARDSEWQWHQLGHMQVCSAPRSRQITMPAPHCSVFLQAGCLAAQPTASKHWRQPFKPFFERYITVFKV